LKYTKATNYALHTIVYMIEYAKNEKLTLHTLADHFNISATYLSKILTQLVKADLIESISGVNGGYILRKRIEDISFLDVISATEGTGALFHCNESKCLIQKVMADAENVMEMYLQDKKIFEVAQNNSDSCGMGKE
jgi:Rrf2 family protein